MDTLKREVCETLGQSAWDALIDGIGVPDVHHESECECRTMRQLMARVDSAVDVNVAKLVLTRVRHGLKRSQFAWARERFAQYNSIDGFIKACLDDETRNFTRLRDSGETFYGQVVDDQVLAFILSQPGMLAPVRVGSGLHITAFPANIASYLKETDERRKRYHACHCPFAQESIVSADGAVSKTLCNCSLGHVKTMWEAIFDVELDGDVVASALNGDLLCKYVVHLPEDVVKKYD
jgi:hypothetical protein